MEIYERVSGARMHAAYIQPFSAGKKMTKNLKNDIYIFCVNFEARIFEIKSMLTGNRIWADRLVNIGNIDINEVINRGLTGIFIRGSGIEHDLRKAYCYEIYKNVKFNIPTTSRGDSFGRYCLRIAELLESTKIIKFCIISKSKIQNKILDFNSIENTIKHFKIFSDEDKFPLYSLYCATETPKGEFGIFLGFSKNSKKIYRCKIRAPGFFSLQSLDYLSKNATISDVVTLIGTQDIVFGEIDK